DRKQAEEELRESERRYRYIFQAAGVSIWEEDFSQVKAAIDELKAQGVRDFRRYLAEHPEFIWQVLPMVKVIDINDTTLKLFAARSKEELLVSLDKVLGLIPVPEIEEVFAEQLIAIAEGQTSFEFENRAQTLKGDKLTVLFKITFPPEPSRFDNVLVSITDITERKLAEEELRQAQAAQFEISLESRVRERTRIARELHDTLLQNFQGLLLRFQSVLKILPDRPLEARQRLHSAIDQAAEAITDARDAIQGLRSLAPETADLAQAITSVGEQLTAQSTIPDPPAIHVEVEGAPHPLNPVVRDEAYRIAVEALRNAFRHAQARRIAVEIRYDRGLFRLRVRDDGKGLDEQAPRRAASAGHFGLHIMRERAEIVGGRLEVRSRMDSGTEVELSIPGEIAYGGSARRSWLSKVLSGQSRDNGGTEP
ncbi:MAG TPA: sensor histidine kinase, partial [Blastocatellia bacterium]|nr:sensor histidine kinase [Blastocatellia bacterium]